MIKRSIDVLAALGALLVLWPFLAVIALVVAVDSPGGAFFRQERVGLGGRPFRIWKFRTMVRDAPKLGPHFTSDHDPRITRVGRLLRRSSLDELPQILNVLTGDMSLVGPRPNVFKQREEYTQAEWDARHAVRPGITGLAQATKRSSATQEERTAMDLEYARERSGLARLALDGRILLMTVLQVLSKGGN